MRTLINATLIMLLAWGLLLSPRASCSDEKRLVRSWSEWGIRGDHHAEFVKDHDRPSLKLSAPETIKDRFGLYQQFKADDYIGHHLKFSGFVVTNDAKKYAGLWIVVLDADQVPLSFADVDNRSGTHVRTRQSLVVDVPKNAYSIMIGLTQVGSGSSVFSDLSLTPVKTKVTSAAPKIDDTRFPVTGRLGEKLDLTLKKSPEAAGRDAQAQLWNWSRHRGDENYHITMDDTGYDGANAVCISAAEHVHGYCTVYQQTRAENYRGQNLRFHGFIKTKNVEDWSGLWMRIDGEGKVLAFDNMEHCPVAGTTDWKEYSVIMPVPQNAHSMRVGFMLADTGEAWLSKPMLDQTSQDAKPTVPPITPFPIPRPDVADKPSLELVAL